MIQVFSKILEVDVYEMSASLVLSQFCAFVHLNSRMYKITQYELLNTQSSKGKDIKYSGRCEKK